MNIFMAGKNKKQTNWYKVNISSVRKYDNLLAIIIYVGLLSCSFCCYSILNMYFTLHMNDVLCDWKTAVEDLYMLYQSNYFSSN